jgi:radical SAM superfamily enzyme YgiQ (UPF0313 family)
MKILFPLEPKAFRKSSSQRLGVMLLSAMLQRHGFQTGLVKATVKDLTQALKDGLPAFLAYSLTSQLAEPMLEVNREIKQKFPEIKSFVGGPHSTFYPEVVEEEGVDGICQGEGEYAIVDIANRIRDGRDFTDLDNWHFKRDGKIIKNKLRPLVQDLDSLPFADRGLMPRNDVNTLVTSRGCPYSCSYCLNAAYNMLYDNKSARIRQRSVDNVIEELRQIKAKHPKTFIGFLDTILPVRRDWTERFAEQYRKEIGIPFYCNIKTEITDKETIKLLKHAGCHSIGIGIESSSDKIRRKFMNRKVSNDKIIEVMNWIHEAGIKAHTFNILGMPETSFEDDIDTLNFNIRVKSDFAVASVLSPYKGTQLHDMVEDLGLLKTDAEYDRGKFHFQTIDYGSDQYARQLINLESLYPMLVAFPFLGRFTGILSRLPLRWLYFRFYSLSLRFVFQWKIFPPYWVRQLTGNHGTGK